MVQYDNPDLFYDHDETHLIIVNSGATVTGVENNTPTIEDNDFLITEDDITDDEIEVRESLNVEENLKFGSMNASAFLVSIFNTSTIPYLKDESIDVYIYFDEDSSTLFKVGRYIVNEDRYSDDRSVRSITAYDILSYLRDYDITDWYNEVYADAQLRTIKYLRDSLFTWLNEDMEDYTIEQETVDLVNDDWEVENSIESDVVTFGFFMQGIMEFNGVFGHINRNGTFCYIQMEWYDKEAVKVFDDEEIFPPIKYGGDDKEITVWGIGYVIVYDRNNTRIAKVGSTNKKHPSNYTIVDSFVITNNLKRAGWKSDLKEALARLREVITHLRYKPFEGAFEGNLCYEVGDRIDVKMETYDEEDDDADDDEPILKSFYSYILERTCKGLQEFEDYFIAKGDKKQPRYKITNDRWHQGDSEAGYSGEGAGGISTVFDEYDEHCVAKDRNKGFRYLDEPNIIDAQYDSDTGKFKVKWEDPSDLTDNKPVKCIWAKTYVVKAENNVPRNIYEGTIIKTSTTRDEYKTSYFEVSVEKNKKYYFAFMPEDTKEDVRWTKVLCLDTEEFISAPTIESVEMGGASDWDGSEVAILYSGNNNSLTVQIANSHIVFKLYSGNTEIYSFTSPVGSGVSDVDKIHVSFLKDDTNYFAKPSFIYETASGVYSYNQENPTDAEMRDIYEWLGYSVPSITGFDAFDLRNVSGGSITNAIYLGSTVGLALRTQDVDAINNSGEVGTGKFFWLKANNGRLPTLSYNPDTVNFANVYTGGHSVIVFPLLGTELPKKFKFSFKVSGTNDGYYACYVATAKIVNGVFVYNNDATGDNRPTMNTKINHEIDLSGQDRIDYIIIGASNSTWTLTDFEITR